MRKNDGRAIPNFINQALNNKNITVFGNGEQTRSFCYIDDTVEGIYKLLISNYKLSVNIGNPKEYSINDLVKVIKSKINTNSKTIYLDLPENDPKTRKPSIDLAMNILQWEPKISLSKGLDITIKFYNKLYNFKS